MSSPALRQLFHPLNLDLYRSTMAEGVATLAHHAGRSDGRPVRGLSPAEASERVRAVDLDAPLGDTGAALAELSQLWLDDAVWFHEPTYAAHLNCPVVIPSLLAEVFVSGVNASLDTFDQSTTGTFVERALVEWTGARIGWGDRSDGVFTSGGSQSNLQALLMARGLAGPAPVENMRVLASHDAHFSVHKSARLLGLADDAVVPVRVDDRRRLDVTDLARALADCDRRGEVVVAVVATAGTTDFGAIDPLPQVAALCRAAGTWLHVDAAYGGGLLVSARHRDRLAGIQLADSVTVDFHKTWFQPVSASAVLVRDGASLRHVTWHADYLNPAGHHQPNQVDKSLQTTRRFDALKLWLTLRTMGADAIGSYLDSVIELTEEVHAELLLLDDVEVAAPPQLSTLVLRYRPRGLGEEETGELNRAVRRHLYEEGEALVAATRVDGRQFLKLTLLNPMATVEDVMSVVDAVRRVGAGLAGEPAAHRGALVGGA